MRVKLSLSQNKVASKFVIKPLSLQNTVNLVPREEAPRGFQLVSADKVGKKNQFDLVELAEVVQKADQFTRATAGSKLTVIAEQVTFVKMGKKFSYQSVYQGAVSARASQEGARGCQAERPST